MCVWVSLTVAELRLSTGVDGSVLTNRVAFADDSLMMIIIAACLDYARWHAVHTGFLFLDPGRRKYSQEADAHKV
jgi:hypothetical protein